jgi:peptide/nickel transport system substrate-binding protein
MREPTYATSRYLEFILVMSLVGNIGAAFPRVAVADEMTTASASKSSVAPRVVTYPTDTYVEQQTGKPGGALRVSVSTDTGTLDLHAIAATNAQWLGRILYDNLVYLDPAGAITPWLARSWTISPDRKTYTFHLRDDVTFSDGVKFNAEAVLVNLEHMRDPATKSPLAAAYIAPYRSGRIVDEYTFEANLDEPYEPFLNVLAQSWLAMLSPKAIKETPKRLGESPVGSGPFVVERYRKQQGISFVKRPDYNWSPEVVGHNGPAYLDRIEVRFVPDPAIRYFSLSSGQYDLTIDAPPQSLSAIVADPSLRFANRMRMGVPNRSLVFNTSMAPFDDVILRRAFVTAIDRDGLARLMGFGAFMRSATFLSVTTPYYDASFSDELKYDVEKAARLLDEAGWTGRDLQGFRTRNGNRLSAEVLITDSATPSPLVCAIQADLKKIGFDLAIVQLPAGILTQRRNTNSYKILSSGVWHTNTPDALYINFHSSRIPSKGRSGQNTARLDDVLLDDLLERARQTGDPSVLRDLYSRAQRRLIELVPALPAYENHSLVAYKAFVKGIVFDTSHETPFFTTVWLDEARS